MLDHGSQPLGRPVAVTAILGVADHFKIVITIITFILVDMINV